MCRLIHGSRISLSVGFEAVGISCIIGVFVGAIPGYFGGRVDFIGMRIVEIMMAIPTFFLIITIVAFLPRSLFNIMFIIGISSWTGDARFIRAEFFKLRKQDFVLAAKSLGLPLRSILFKHMLPNGITPVLVNATFGIAGAIFTEASLSFLGFGVAPPTPSWGQMLSLGVSTSGRFLWWLTLFPGLAIFLTVLALSIVGLIPDPPGKIVKGRILFNGKNLLELREKEMRAVRGNKIAMIFQEPMTSLNPVYTIGDRIVEAIMLHQNKVIDSAWEEGVEILRRVGIADPEQRASVVRWDETTCHDSHEHKL